MHYPATRQRDVQGRATVNQPHATPTLLYAGHFSTRPGYVTLRDHGTQDWLLFYTLAGSGRIVHLDGPLLTKRGDCVILPPGLRHDYRIAEGCATWEFLWAHFVPWPHWYGLLSWPQRYKGIKYLHVADTGAHGRVSGCLQRMVDATTAPAEQSELFAMNALEEALLWLNSANPQTGQPALDSRIRAATDHLCANLSERISLAALGRRIGLSASRLSHLFHSQTGLTPIQYLEQQRMRKARELLELSAFSVSQVAYQVGYESAFYFSRRFSKAVGVGPREYRRANARR
jgi:AraC family transcriptional regulator of arabinose operon